MPLLASWSTSASRLAAVAPPNLPSIASVQQLPSSFLAQSTVEASDGHRGGAREAALMIVKVPGSSRSPFVVERMLVTEGPAGGEFVVNRRYIEPLQRLVLEGGGVAHDSRHPQHEEYHNPWYISPSWIALGLMAAVAWCVWRSSRVGGGEAPESGGAIERDATPIDGEAAAQNPGPGTSESFRPFSGRGHQLPLAAPVEKAAGEEGGATSAAAAAAAARAAGSSLAGL